MIFWRTLLQRNGVRIVSFLGYAPAVHIDGFRYRPNAAERKFLSDGLCEAAVSGYGLEAPPAQAFLEAWARAGHAVRMGTMDRTDFVVAMRHGGASAFRRAHGAGE